MTKYKDDNMLEAQVKNLFSEPQRILIVKEKHGDRYFVINSRADLHRAALKIVKERYDHGYWYHAPKRKEDIAKPAYSKKEIEQLKGAAKEAALAELRRYERELKYHKIAEEQYALALAAVKENDGEAAYELLDWRRDCEYEGFELERPEEF